jgi:spore germination protein GerM
MLDRQSLDRQSLDRQSLDRQSLDRQSLQSDTVHDQTLHPVLDVNPQPKKLRFKTWQIIGALVSVVAIAGGSTALMTWKSINSDPLTSQPTITSQVQPPASIQAPVEQTVQVYWLKVSEQDIDLAPATLKLTVGDRPTDILKGAMEQLLKGTTDQTFTSTIPTGTLLNRLEIKDDGIHIDLSQAFTNGGGSSSMMGRLGQVVYTATTLDPNGKVWISVEGEPLQDLGGEGIVVDQPMTRTNFEENFEL